MAVTADPPNASLSKDDVAGLVRLLQAEGQLDDKPQALAAYQRLTVLWERGDAPSGSGSTLEELKLIKTVVQEVWPASEAPASSLSNMGETAH